jgi:hypothetical protein
MHAFLIAMLWGWFIIFMLFVVPLALWVWNAEKREKAKPIQRHIPHRTPADYLRLIGNPKS